MVPLKDYQIDAANRMKNGCILCGGVGSGKSRTALYYYFTKNGGRFSGKKTYPITKKQPLYIITTARKRDTLEWEAELIPFLISGVKVDSWNNIGKYTGVKGAFFIFDEQRVVGWGKWSKSFVKIARMNDWILLSATPGDKWEDYMPVFIANGFYRNPTEFRQTHLVYKQWSKFPQVDHYENTGRLIKLRNSILIDMDFIRPTVSHDEDVVVSYRKNMYKDIMKERWNLWEGRPIRNASELCYALRRVVNADEERLAAVCEIFEDHPKIIVFYNFDYELGLLKNLWYGDGVEIAEWNGHRHEPIPDRDRWVYLVQYTAGAEGWNCIKTDTIIFYSQTYSYKTLMQAKGRIDRMNTPFKDLYYYHLISRAPIDVGIRRALKDKRAFNERRFVEKHGG